MLNLVKAKLAQFKNDERGVTAIEYAIIAVAIAAIVATVFGDTGLTGALESAMDSIVSKVNPPS